MSLLLFVTLVINSVLGWEGNWFGPGALNENGEPMAMCHMTDVNIYPSISNISINSKCISIHIYM